MFLMVKDFWEWAICFWELLHIYMIKFENFLQDTEKILD